MADLYGREQCFSSVKIYKDLTVFDIEALCFRSQLKNEEPHRVFLSSTRVTSESNRYDVRCLHENNTETPCIAYASPARSTMALNTAHAQGGVLIFAVERILIYYNGIEMQFEGPSGMPHFKGKKKGRVYLTTHRVIFNSSDAKDTMQSFSFPFLQMREVELEQPVFGANYIKGRVLAEQSGNWEGEAKFKMYFTHGGAIEFGQAMLKAASLASRNRMHQPPSYAAATGGNIYAAPPPAYTPPQDPYYAWVPYQTFPTAPPDNSVYMTEAPPPYPGINPDMAPYPPAANGHDAKAREAAASAYYNPTAPHMMYASAPPPPSGYAAPPYQGYEPPPAYDQAAKKTN